MLLTKAELSKCPKCGNSLAPDAPGDNCIACLLRLGFELDGEEELLSDDEWLEAAAEGWPQIGNYRIVRELGEGGFGVVYAAEQLHPVRRDVAVKVIKPGMDTRGVIARFVSEQQALAVMDHPNIARVFDAGSTASGRAFFAMELVAGAPLTEFCDIKKLTIAARIELFIEICQAVQHAHQKGVIHRDLKPGNVLITDPDGKPAPKIIDFGIAKATGGQRLSEQTLFSAYEPFIGTPAYMSPEQADFGSVDIDTRSDIYSLGVMLYELLAGVLPFRDAVRSNPDEMRRRIREEQPSRPSTAYCGLSMESMTGIAAGRAVDPSRLIRELRGDLDWIVMKTLEKDRARRYATATGLALDLRRFLDGQPVSARPPSTLYQLQKFCRRNKATVAAIAVIAIAIITAAIVSTAEAVRARRAEQRALTEASKTEQTAEFLENAFQSVSPVYSHGQDTALMRGILDGADQHIKEQLSQSPEVEAHLRRIIGWTYNKIGDGAKAEANLNEAVRISGTIPGDEMEHCVALNWLANVQLARDSILAEKTAREAYPLQMKLAASMDPHSPDGRGLATYGVALGKILIIRGQPGNLEEGVAITRKWLVFQKAALGNYDLAIAGADTTLGEAEENRHNFEQAERDYREALDIREKIDGPDTLDVANSIGHVAGILEARGDLAGAEALDRQALGTMRKLLAGQHPLLVPVIAGLAQIRMERGDLQEASQLLSESLAMAQKVSTARKSRRLLDFAGQLAGELEKQGDKEKAAALRSQAAQVKAALGTGS